MAPQFVKPFVKSNNNDMRDTEAIAEAVTRPVVYLSPTDNSAGPVWSRPRDVNRTVLTSHIGFPRPDAGRLPCP